MQIGIVDVVEDSRGFVECTLHRPFRVDPLVAHDRGGPSDDNRIVEHQQLLVGDGSEVGAVCRRDAPPDLLELSTRSLAGAFQRRQLARDTIGTDRETQYLRPLNRDERGTDCDPGGYANTVPAFHDSSPHPDATSSTSASTARSSSGPSAITVSVVPRDAAKSRIPMMLFPSMTFESRPTRIRDSNRVARCTNRAAARACSPS